MIYRPGNPQSPSVTSWPPCAAFPFRLVLAQMLLPGTGLQMAGIKKFGQLRLAKCENLSYITLHKESLYDPAPQNGIANSIGAKGAFITLLKTVFMNPPPIRTLDLLVDKPEWRFPDGNPCSPAHGNAVNPNPVVDECPNAASQCDPA